MEFSCEQIGMDQSELQDRVVRGLAETARRELKRVAAASTIKVKTK